MIIVDNAVLSDDLKENFFVCNLEKCKGACCVEGDLGAPLEKEELPLIEEVLEEVKPYLSEEGLKAIEAQGPYILDEEGDYSTTTIGDKECAFAYYDEHRILKCGIEQAYLDGKIDYKKPISCQHSIHQQCKEHQTEEKLIVEGHGNGLLIGNVIKNNKLFYPSV